MIFNRRILFLFFTVLCLAGKSSAQVAAEVDTSTVLISALQITGNKHSKEYIILREMPFKSGDRLLRKDITKIFMQARNQVDNTNLFSEVKIDSSANADSTLTAHLYLKEKWYVFPTPQFRIVDRSYNEWIKTYNADLNRVVYGAKFAHYNFSGRRDQLRVYLLNGYARNFSVAYSRPFIDRKLTIGAGASAGYTQNREVGYKTSYNNKILNFKRDGFVSRSFSSAISVSRRRGFFTNTAVGIGFTYINADDSLVRNINPKYFNDADHSQAFPDFSVGFGYSNTDNVNYPLKGLTYNSILSKRGLRWRGGINNMTVQGSISKYFTHPRNWYSSLQAAGMLRLPFEQAYINQRAIGYGNLNLRGLELYVVDGVAAAVAKYTLSKKITSFRIKLPFKIRSLPYIPFTFYGKTYADAGYSYLPEEFNTRLNNRLLYTGGFGIDVVTFYNIVFKVEYSFNQLGEKGLFLHGRGAF